METVLPTPTDAAALVLSELEPRAALAGNSTFGRLSADVLAAVLFVHAAQTFCEEEKQLEGMKHERKLQSRTMKPSLNVHPFSETFKGSV